ncbi:hypothetical protein C8R47DRAFT_1082732 [Mycena vitilis]|nr:hypothetical protein C8R47DRAFT_1082732 [Mycena vitilis]
MKGKRKRKKKRKGNKKRKSTRAQKGVKGEHENQGAQRRDGKKRVRRAETRIDPSREITPPILASSPARRKNQNTRTNGGETDASPSNKVSRIGEHTPCPIRQLHLHARCRLRAVHLKVQVHCTSTSTCTSYYHAGTFTTHGENPLPLVDAAEAAGAGKVEDQARAPLAGLPHQRTARPWAAPSPPPMRERKDAENRKVEAGRKCESRALAVTKRKKERKWKESRRKRERHPENRSKHVRMLRVVVVHQGLALDHESPTPRRQKRVYEPEWRKDSGEAERMRRMRRAHGRRRRPRTRTNVQTCGDASGERRMQRALGRRRCQRAEAGASRTRAEAMPTARGERTNDAHSGGGDATGQRRT